MPVLLTRRAIALAAPALLLSRNAFALAPGIVGWNGNVLIKPSGTPTFLSSAPLAASMLFYAIDNGAGSYTILQDCSPGHAFDPTSYYNGVSPNYGPGTPPYDPKLSLIPTGSTPYGTALLWPGGGFPDGQTPGAGCTVQLQAVDAIRTAINLASAGAGAGFTLFATHRQTGACQAGLICGKGQNLDVGPAASFALNTHGTSINDTNSNLVFAYSSAADGTAPNYLISNNPCGINTLCSSVVSIVNTAPGVSTITMYVNGTQQAQVTGATVLDVSAANSQQEDQLQVGSYFHVQAGQCSFTYNGSVYQYGIANRAWSQADAQSFAGFPYQMVH